MPFSCFADLSGIPLGYVLDPPFREIDFSDETAVRTMSVVLRAAWITDPWNNDSTDQASQVPSTRTALHRFMRDYTHMSDEERSQLQSNPDNDDTHSLWRKEVCFKWQHVFADTADFLWDVNGTTIGHWHPDTVEAHPDEALGQLVVKYGQKPMEAVQQTFDHNVLITPAFLDQGVKIRVRRLPVQDGGYDLEESKELGTWTNEDKYGLWFWTNENGAQLWFIRRGVPVEFVVESTGGEGEVELGKGVAAVFIYGNLCLEVHRDIEEQVNCNLQVMQELAARASSIKGDRGTVTEET